MIQLLNHGYCKLIETWGSDEGIVEAARMSTAKGFTGWGTGAAKDAPCPGPTQVGVTCVDGVLDGGPGCRGNGMPCHICEGRGKLRAVGDEKLLAYLYRNKHSTPFEMAGLTIEVQAPIFVFRQWHRHRTQSYNEMSARYTPLPNMNYMPTIERLLINSKSNKQAGTTKGSDVLTAASAESFRGALAEQYMNAESLYQTALSLGVPKELARVHLPVARYSRMRASANLRNWLGFLTLRMDPHAQHEIRVYANAVGELIKQYYPRTWALFIEGRSPTGEA